MRERLAQVGITRGVLAVCLLWLVAAGPIVADMTAQGAPRFAFAGAVVDDRAIKLDGYLVGYDKAERDGHVYSDKAPGQQVLSVPFYAAARAAGAEPASVPRVEGNLSLWWVTFWTAGVPLRAIICMTAVAAWRRGSPIPVPALVGLSFGTMLLPHSVNLYGHVLGAALGFAAWLVLDRPGGSWRSGAAAGALAGSAVAVEYPLAVVAMVLGIWLLARGRWAQALAFALAGAPFAIAVGTYQAVAFGSPFSSGYTDKEPLAESTVLVTGIPNPITLLQVLVGARGLLVFMPIVAVGIYGLFRRWFETRDDGAVVALAVVGGVLLVQAGWSNPWGGDSAGPRYVTPMLPFLAVGLSTAWASVPPRLRRLVLGVSLTSMVLPTITLHLVNEGAVLISGSIAKLVDNGLNPTVWSLAFGWLGTSVWAVTSGAAIWHLCRVVAETDVATTAQPGEAAPLVGDPKS